MSSVILVGGFHETVELCERCGRQLVGIIDNRCGTDYLGYEVLGSDGRAAEIHELYPDVPVVISPDQPQTRLRLAAHYEDLGFHFETLVDPAATASPRADLGRGVLVQAGATVSPGVRLGDFVRINVGARVMHDTDVGRGSTIAPSAVLLGRVRVRERSYIGAAAVLLPGIVVGEGAVVGAGAVVTKDVAAGTTVAGSPARVLR